jgi:membrane protein YqaA with SNARE-associated domain
LDAFFRHLLRVAYHAGAFGLFAVGVLDSSFLFLPLGNDFLMLGLSARHHERVPLYVAVATLGSMLGVMLTFWLAGKGGASLDAQKKNRRRKYVEKQIKDRGGLALGVASLLPPPFPFTVFVAAAGALKVPWGKAMPYIAGGRLLRFAIEGVLAIHYGRWILSLAESPAFRDVAIAMLVIAVAGSAYSVYGWVRH